MHAPTSSTNSPLRVLLISHTCQSPTEGQPKPQHLAALNDIDLRVLIPNRWKHYGQWRHPKLLPDPRFTPLISRVRLPWVGPAQFYLHYYPDLRKTLLDFRPHIIDIWEEAWALVSSKTCALRDRYLPSAKIITETEQNIDRKLPFPFEQFRRHTLTRADHAIARSREAAEVLRQRGFSKQIDVVPNGVDDSLFRPLDKEKCRKELGFTHFTVGYVGRLVEEKGLMDLVDALSLCPDDIHCIFLGTGPFEPALRRRVAQLNLVNRVYFLPARPLDQLPIVMNALDAFILPSRTTLTWKEQFGRVLIEAQACATPTLGSNSGAIPDVIGQAGLTFQERNPASLADAIKTLHADPAKSRQFGQQGLAQVQRTYTWQRIAVQMRAIYDQLAANYRLI